MKQMRFQIGVPKAGSSARSAEREPVPDRRGSLAGSAARAAEAAKRISGNAHFAGAAPIAMRSQGGKVFRRPLDAPVETQHVAASALQSNKPEDDSHSPSLSIAPDSVARPAEGNTSPGFLQTTLTRVQSLARSLFVSGDRTT